MNAKHTPGPWSFSRSTELGDTRYYVAQAEGAPYTPHYSDVATLIAETVNDERRSIQEANARLISASPQLLEACEMMLACMVLANWEGDEAAIRARAAIAKATGETL